ncbi:MAG TPA: N(G),N(G)-dimethylarginine dimethylaminohydrolase [Thermoanaerobaculia bacterium]|nr:N(G),N(G)-dimethylarginine dimethylaminohydrolase [Thermoanaerobaculia bacterium]
MLHRAIVRPPSENFADGLTTVDLGAPDFGMALEQHERYCEALVTCGLELTRLRPDPLYPDSTFVEDTALMLPKSAILTRPGAPSRDGEIVEMESVLQGFFPSLRRIQPPGTVDGGDICDAGPHWFIGVSARTNEEGARQLTGILAEAGFTSSRVDIRGVAGILHLKSGIAHVSDRKLVVIDSLAADPAFESWEIVPVDAGEEYAANCVSVNGRLLFPKGFPRLEARLRTLGERPLVLDMSEFQKMDGGLSCLSLRF